MFSVRTGDSGGVVNSRESFAGRSVVDGGKRVLGSKGEVGDEERRGLFESEERSGVRVGKSVLENRGEDNGDRLLWRCSSRGGSSNKDSLSRWEIFLK